MILRRATRERPEFHYVDEIERISVETSHPRWLIEKWAGEFGINEAENLAVANNEIPKPAFRLLRPIEEIDKAIRDSWWPSEFVDGCGSAARGFDSRVNHGMHSGSVRMAYPLIGNGPAGK